MLTLPHNPPYNTDLEIPDIPTGHEVPDWPAWPEIMIHKRENVCTFGEKSYGSKEKF